MPLFLGAWLLPPQRCRGLSRTKSVVTRLNGRWTAKKRALKLAATLLSSRYPEIKVSWTEDGQVEGITADNFADITNGVLTDEISRATEDPATVFRFDKNAQDYFKISTTVTNQDRSRAVGTNLGAQSAAYASIMRGESYHGEAKILGIPYYTVYQPIMGKTETPPIGILFTGVKVSTITGAGQMLITKIWIASAIFTAVFAAAGFWMARCVFSPVTRLAKAVNQGGGDGEPFEIPYRQSKNEIWKLARAIANYRNRAAIARAALQRRNGELLEKGLWTLNEASFALHVPNSKGPKRRRIKPIALNRRFFQE